MGDINCVLKLTKLEMMSIIDKGEQNRKNDEQNHSIEPSLE